MTTNALGGWRLRRGALMAEIKRVAGIIIFSAAKNRGIPRITVEASILRALDIQRA